MLPISPSLPFSHIVKGGVGREGEGAALFCQTTSASGDLRNLDVEKSVWRVLLEWLREF